MLQKNLIIIALFALFGCDSKVEQKPVVREVAPTEELPDYVPPVEPIKTDAAKAVVKATDQINFFEKRLKGENPTWVSAAKVIGGYTSRFRMIGNVDDLVKANEVAAETVKTLNDPETLQIALARLYNTQHRIADARNAAKRAQKIARAKDEQAAPLGVLGDLSMQEGKLDAAQEQFEAAHKLKSDSGSAIRLSNLFMKRGDIGKATEWADEAVKLSKFSSKQTKAFALLIRGIVDLETGKLDGALSHFEKANDLFGGWYLIEEHIAEVHALKENWTEAKKRYEDVLTRVPNGEFFDALAGVEEAMGNADQAKELRVKALAKLRADVKKLPSAMGGHALDAILEHGTAEEALALAKQNHTLRPGFEEKCKLAHAYLNSGKLDDAFDVLNPVIDSDWNTVDCNVLIAKVLDGKGDEKASALYLERAEKIQPGSSK